MTTASSFAPPAGVNGPTYTVDQVRAIIDTEAAARGVPAPLAEAVAQQESGFNPYAIGDGGTSFGENQLHEGGELNNLPGSLSQQIAAAFDPKTNEDVALGELASVYAANPNADPGQIAAAAQRPADRAGYAAAIDNILRGGSSSSTGGTTAGATNVSNPITSAVGSAASSVWNDVKPFLLTGMFAVGAIALGVVGARQLVQPTTDKIKDEAAGGAKKMAAVAAL